MKQYTIRYFQIPLNPDGTLEHPIVFEEAHVEADSIQQALEIAADLYSNVFYIAETDLENHISTE